MFRVSGSSGVFSAYSLLRVRRWAGTNLRTATPSKRLIRRRHTSIYLLVLLAAGWSTHGYAQTPSSGALTGITVDRSGALLGGATVRLANQDTSQTRKSVSDAEGRFGFLLLIPGKYELCARKADFATVCSSGININVTETRRVELRLHSVVPIVPSICVWGIFPNQFPRFVRE